jgi:predicted ester cyclase
MTTTAERLAWNVLDVLHSGDVAALEGVVSDDFVDHGAPPGLPSGRAGYAGTMRWLHDTLQIRYEVHDVVAAGDKVAIRATAHGIHRDGHLGFAPTGKAYALETMHMYRERDGLLVEHWGVRDELGVLRQVGALPTPGADPAPADGAVA